MATGCVVANSTADSSHRTRAQESASTMSAPEKDLWRARAAVIAHKSAIDTYAAECARAELFF